MMSLLVKVTEASAAHIHLSVFSGVKGQTRACNGQLCFSPPEYVTFMAMLLMAKTTLRMVHDIEIDDGVAKAWIAKNGPFMPDEELRKLLEEIPPT